MGRAWIKATKHPFRQSQRSSLSEGGTKSNEARRAQVRKFVTRSTNTLPKLCTVSPLKSLNLSKSNSWDLARPDEETAEQFCLLS